mmetsp:Transcript_13876/g.54814  ORF Transcript_13876/g.54814 Transcript_13876/m.54814 type:complete len:279 (-) Transcript_13876:464-1300(-)
MQMLQSVWPSALFMISAFHWRRHVSGAMTRLRCGSVSGRTGFASISAREVMVFPQPMSSARMPPLTLECSWRIIQARAMRWCFISFTRMPIGVDASSISTRGLNPVATATSAADERRPSCAAGAELSVPARKSACALSGVETATGEASAAMARGCTSDTWPVVALRYIAMPLLVRLMVQPGGTGLLEKSSSSSSPRSREKLRSSSSLSSRLTTSSAGHDFGAGVGSTTVTVREMGWVLGRDTCQMGELSSSSMISLHRSTNALPSGFTGSGIAAGAAA